MRFGATGRRSEAHRHRHTYKAHTVAHARRVHAVRITCNAQFARVRRGIISYVRCQAAYATGDVSARACARTVQNFDGCAHGTHRHIQAVPPLASLTHPPALRPNLVHKGAPMPPPLCRRGAVADGDEALRVVRYALRRTNKGGETCQRPRPSPHPLPSFPPSLLPSASHPSDARY